MEKIKEFISIEFQWVVDFYKNISKKDSWGKFQKLTDFKYNYPITYHIGPWLFLFVLIVFVVVHYDNTNWSDFFGVFLTICFGFMSLFSSSRFSKAMSNGIFVEHVLGYLSFHFNFNDKNFVCNRSFGIITPNSLYDEFCVTIDHNCSATQYYRQDHTSKKELIESLYCLSFVERMRCLCDIGVYIDKECKNIVFDYIYFRGKRKKDYENFRDLQVDIWKWFIKTEIISMNWIMFNKMDEPTYHKIQSDCWCVIETISDIYNNLLKYEIRIFDISHEEYCKNDELIDFYNWFNIEVDKGNLDKKEMNKRMIDIGLIVEKN